MLFGMQKKTAHFYGDLSPKASSLSSPLLDNQGGKITNGENNEATQTITVCSRKQKRLRFVRC